MPALSNTTADGTADPMQVHLQVSFMILGLDRSTPTLGSILDHWDGGSLSLISELIKYAQYASDLMYAGHNVTGDYPGVGEYDVSEAFGGWFGEQVAATPEPCTVPAAVRCCDKLVELANAFFMRGYDGDGAALLTALRRVEARIERSCYNEE